MGKPRSQNEILLTWSVEIECLGFRFPTASLTEGESLLHLFKLECQGPKCADLDYKRGCFKAANQACRKILDESDMLMLHIENPTPINFPREKCIGASEISSKIFTSRSSTKTIR